MPDVSVIIVSMNRPDLLYPCLDDLYATTAASLEVLVVAYRYTPENLADLRAKYPSVLVEESPELRGFSENNNLALRRASGRFCLIVNDDTRIRMPLIDSLLEDFSRLPSSAAAVSPKIVFPDGRIQTLGRAPWTACRYLRHYLHWVDETRPSKWSMKEGLFQTWTLNGACFLIRTDVFREAGWFDETYTFTPEDIALGHRLNDMGYTVWADSDIEITHLAGGTVSAWEPVIKPVRVRGALLFYGRGCGLRRFGLSCFIWCVESLRQAKWWLVLHFSRSHRPDSTTSCPANAGHLSRAAILHASARNVRRYALFTRRSPKDIFLDLYRL